MYSLTFSCAIFRSMSSKSKTYPALQLQKVAADKAASVLLYCAVKRRIGGVIEQYAVPWLRQRAHAAADCQHQAVGLEEPLRLYPPAVAARHPGAYLTLQALRRS